MNRVRRKKLDDIITQLENVQSRIDTVRDEEDGCLYNTPDNLADSDRANQMQNSIDLMENAITQLDEAIDMLRDAKG